jgi:hypothetical protein
MPQYNYSEEYAKYLKIRNSIPNVPGADQIRAKLDEEFNQASNMYGMQQTEGAQKAAFSPDLINQLYQQASGALSTRQAQDVGRAKQGASAMAASRSFLNPSGFTQNAGSQIFGAYAPQFANLEMGKTQALQNQGKDLYQALFGEQQANRQYGLQQQGLDLKRKELDQNQAGVFDYLSAFMPLAKPLLFPNWNKST